MPTLICIEHNGTEHRIDAPVGQSVMQAALNAMVPGILAQCGGACSCATCHAYVDDEWLDRLPAAASTECDLIEGAVEPRANSRLTCQITMTAETDGLVIRLPHSQM